MHQDVFLTGTIRECKSHSILHNLMCNVYTCTAIILFAASCTVCMCGYGDLLLLLLLRPLGRGMIGTVCCCMRGPLPALSLFSHPIRKMFSEMEAAPSSSQGRKKTLGMREGGGTTTIGGGWQTLTGPRAREAGNYWMGGGRTGKRSKMNSKLHKRPQAKCLLPRGSQTFLCHLFELSLTLSSLSPPSVAQAENRTERESNSDSARVPENGLWSVVVLGGEEPARQLFPQRRRRRRCC